MCCTSRKKVEWSESSRNARRPSISVWGQKEWCDTPHCSISGSISLPLSLPVTLSAETLTAEPGHSCTGNLYWQAEITNQSKTQKETFVKLKYIPLSVQVTDELKRSGNTYSPLQQVAIKLQLSFQCKIYWGSCKALFNLNGS